MNKKLGLYIHIPFCKRKCKYCLFYSTSDFSNELINNYINLVILQIEKYSLVTKKYNVDSIYFGGGSPSSIYYKYIDAILQKIYSKFNINKKIEITLECNPEDLNKEYINTINKSIINRVSLGVQSLIDKELKLLNRNYNIYNIINILEELTINNISIDLMYALPFQTLKNIMFNINKTIQFGIKHISIYNFEPNHIEFKKMNYPSEALQFLMYEKINEKLMQNNFFRYEISNFSKSHFESKHNKKYWNLNEYLGIGAGAHSFFNKTRFSNSCNIYNFFEKTIYDQYNINNYEEYMMLKIRTKEGINLNYIKKMFNIEINLEKIYFLTKNKLLYKRYNNYILTERGIFIIEKVIYELLT